VLQQVAIAFAMGRQQILCAKVIRIPGAPGLEIVIAIDRRHVIGSGSKVEAAVATGRALAYPVALLLKYVPC
jgi:hypothetical protein